MTCRELTFDVIDFARGVALDPAREATLENHLRLCESCAGLVERERAMSVALQRLAAAQVPVLNPVRLKALLASFDRPRARSRQARIAVGLSLAASVLIVVSLSVGVQRQTVPGAPRTVAETLAPATSADTAFMVLPGADALPRLESGRVIRIEIPESALSSVGLWPPAHAGSVQADVLVGQDGLARAIRLVQ
jgi:predicted anti-sigma-YlaC factor YlaD